MIESDIAAEGPMLTLRWAKNASGRMPAKEFFDSLPKAEKFRMQSLFDRLALCGQIWNKQSFKKVEGTKMFEFKHFQIRFIGSFAPNKEFLLAHGLKKKRDKLRKQDIKSAKVTLEEARRRI